MTPPPPFEVAYTKTTLPTGVDDFLPLLQVNIGSTNALPFNALLDTGAVFNILPYSAGLKLGLDWNSQQLNVRIGGILSGKKSFGVVLPVQFGSFPAIPMAFAWTEDDHVPVILGR